MGVIIGVVVGYAMGTRAGSGGWAELEDAWHTITTSEEVHDLIEGALAIARDVVGHRAEILAGVLGLGDDVAKLRQAA
jgi:hypothetical protein